ncbi:hypothetical protein QE372_004508 [Agrobacterium pusense]|uniref:hypothetical protein n=1 Tax=Agrobacterium pusense TaxID=648995 RepID=UPI0005ED550C|nr:hypothetical protein [Agrobacterium pusense]MDR6192193.1 hypothetical protein [Agrobacterium pusense]OAI91362.1 hypothetical protein AYO27_24415 [Rhizobium sp. GHKF11]
MTIPDRKCNASVALVALVLFCVFCYASLHIDFHPDEAIYFDGIPFSTRKDTGIFYSLVYTSAQLIYSGPVGARFVSAIFGAGTYFFMMKTILLVVGGNRSKVVLLGTLVFICSYQAFFVFVRVRPEAAWWFCSAIAVYGLARLRVSFDRISLSLVSGAVAILPMNHRLSWFACIFIGLYIVFYVFRDNGLRTAATLLIAMASGVLLNAAIPALILHLPVFQTIVDNFENASPGIERYGAFQFFEYVFSGTPDFLNDFAKNPNLYQMAGLGFERANHSVVQIVPWMLSPILLIFSRSWRQFFSFLIPVLFYFLFWKLNYFNPTYSAGISLFVVCLCLYLCLDFKGPALGRIFSAFILMLSFVNGMSFLTTRVFNHGEATYFGVEEEIRSYIADMDFKPIAIPERYLPVSQNWVQRPIVTFKQPLTPDLEILVLDEGDVEMYRFVPDYRQRIEEIEAFKRSMCLKRVIKGTVYDDDDLFEPNRLNGSWFFRNSVSTNISIYERCSS